MLSTILRVIASSSYPISVSENHKKDLNNSFVYKLRPSHYHKQKELDLTKLKSYIDETISDGEDSMEVRTQKA